MKGTIKEHYLQYFAQMQLAHDPAIWCNGQRFTDANTGIMRDLSMSNSSVISPIQAEVEDSMQRVYDLALLNLYLQVRDASNTNIPHFEPYAISESTLQRLQFALKSVWPNLDEGTHPRFDGPCIADAASWIDVAESSSFTERLGNAASKLFDLWLFTVVKQHD